ncbi:2,3,4,5-tetrahydropyridine-2,6-dicarboxylate N-acetyltransferase [Candidatus Lokiarchaeum ossiferum]|uniref:serine O-acetyltransferase n=1 Tax=Candidatus Lokiarchaeum ossiferum TaxID=2951803 RepID=A0ABY6HVH1_9ARCH|nr:2,3,4,5-tetrahydropyridine-2,6-dicarboxylate N-acetyltransferase [Candidatus Lokiarchaeum sp. B-35]
MIKSNSDICINCGHKLSEKGDFMNLMGLTLDIPESQKESVFHDLEDILHYFASDVTSAFKKDPAAKNLVEVLTSYPGIQAVLLHRIAHFFFRLGLPFVPRYISNIARQITGIDIHPGAKIGKNLFIDHGTGVVIGETAEIGDNVILYQGVTLGGIHLENEKRHPTLRNNIIVGAGAKLLGPIILGDNVKVGANSVVTKDIPPNSIVVGVPGRIIKNGSNIPHQIETLSHDILPDPVLNLIKSLESRIKDLESQISIKK